MPDTSTSNQQNGGNDFNVNSLTHDIFGTVNTLGTAYFAEQTAKSALKAPAANTAIVIGGVVIVAVLIYLVVRK